jgi:uncharacterized protein YkwD
MRGEVSAEAVVSLLLVIVALSLLYISYGNGTLGSIIPNLTHVESTTSIYASSTTVTSTTATTISGPKTTIQSTATTTMATTTVPGVNQALFKYALSLINNDRKDYGLSNVTLSPETSGQQHSQDMLNRNYFSHWDTYGMKPYLRYTLLNGRGSVTENVAYQYSAMCGLLGCSGNINVTDSLKEMEYSMMYNDSECCNDGHRYNILDANHNQVSIGIAYNSSTVYFTEDFVDNYVNWTNYGPNAANYEMYMSGSLSNSFRINSTIITYEPPVSNMSIEELKLTSSYGYGGEVAGVVSSPLYYYPGLTTIVADKYSVTGNKFEIDFNMRDLISKNGAGEYTIFQWMDDQRGVPFLGSTFTVFVDSGGKIFVPKNV